MNISLPTGKVISVSYYEWLFKLKDDEVHGFVQACVAEDLGIVLENPFSAKSLDKLEVEDENNSENYFENPIE